MVKIIWIRVYFMSCWDHSFDSVYFNWHGINFLQS